MEPEALAGSGLATPTAGGEFHPALKTFVVSAETGRRSLTPMLLAPFAGARQAAFYFLIFPAFAGMTARRDQASRD